MPGGRRHGSVRTSVVPVQGYVLAGEPTSMSAPQVPQTLPIRHLVSVYARSHPRPPRPSAEVWDESLYLGVRGTVDLQRTPGYGHKKASEWPNTRRNDVVHIGRHAITRREPYRVGNAQEPRGVVTTCIAARRHQGTGGRRSSASCPTPGEWGSGLARLGSALTRTQDARQRSTQKALYLVSFPIEPGAFTWSFTWYPCWGWNMNGVSRPSRL